jgi:hypothetical protein
MEERVTLGRMESGKLRVSAFLELLRTISAIPLFGFFLKGVAGESYRFSVWDSHLKGIEPKFSRAYFAPAGGGTPNPVLGCRVRYLLVKLFFAVAVASLAGCGTSRWTDTSRTATEQLLISDAIDRAVSRLDLRALAGKTVFLDDTPIRGMTDSAYLGSTLRQHLLASGAILKENKSEAEYVLEVRAGAIGTDRHDVTYGIPAVNIPTLVGPPLPGLPNQLPEVPLAKKTQQRAVVKIALFAYNRTTGRPVWQSGTIPVETDVRALWLLGAGPFLRSPTANKLIVAGDALPVPPVHLPLDSILPDGGPKSRPPSVTQQAFFIDRAPPDAAQDQKGQTPLVGTQAEESLPQAVPGGGPVPSGGDTAPGDSSKENSVAAAGTSPPAASGDNPADASRVEPSHLPGPERGEASSQTTQAPPAGSPEPQLLPPLDVGELLPGLERTLSGSLASPAGHPGSLPDADASYGLVPPTPEGNVRQAGLVEPWWPIGSLGDWSGRGHFRAEELGNKWLSPMPSPGVNSQPNFSPLPAIPLAPLP